MTPNQLRTKYLEFFESHGHARVPSSPLVPENDPSTLFTGSGMQPMVPYLLGQKHPLGSRIVDSQKCFRSQDIEEVGDNRHTTFFEMLGNWSLGDYFKHDQLTWFFTFLTQEIGLDPNKLFVTVFRGNEALGIGRDVDSVEIWKQLFDTVGIIASDVDMSEKKGMQGGKIFYYDDKKNWWSRAGVPTNMPLGEPGGPDSEVFYDFGAELQLHEHSLLKDQPCHVNCDCGRFLEIGNSVFMEFIKTESGFTPLPAKNVDFGGGFERILAVLENQRDVFQTGLFTPIIQVLEKKAARKYLQDVQVTRSFRVIADHVKAAVMLAADGVFPSNKAQGYFSRRLIRRAIRHAKMIGVKEPFLSELIPVIDQMYTEVYPEIHSQLIEISTRLSDEEVKFEFALAKGMHEIEKIDQITPKQAFQLYETYGFPFEVTQEIAAEKGIALDIAAFEREKMKHSQASRTASSGMFKGGLQDHSQKTTQFHTATHLLHAALRKILGTHVQQKGSNITSERLRFDFSHPTALSDEQKTQIIDQVNAWISDDLSVTKQVMRKQEALDSGAIAFFIEKYPDEVSVYTIGEDDQKNWVSKELCGGPHVERTGMIDRLVIQKEQAVSAGVRRLYVTFE